MADRQQQKRQDQKRQAVLDAALVAFSRYGFRRTSMEDIAQAAGVSRPALYLMFDNKEDVFRTLSQALLALSVDRAEAALNADGPFVERLSDAIRAKEAVLFEVIHGSPHGAELIDMNAQMAADITQQAEARYGGILTDAIAAAAARGEVDLTRSGLDAPTVADLIVRAVHGMKTPVPDDSKAFTDRLSSLIGLIGASLSR